LNCEGSIPVYFMTWGWLDGTTWIEGYSDTYEELAQKIIDETREWAADTGLMVAPYGAVWKNIVTGSSNIELFDPDLTHPTLAGTYLNACVLYCCLFQESISGNSFHGGLPAQDAEFLQLAASTELMFNGFHYNITPPDSNLCPAEE
ncbi:MAG TPA: hypothetical protein VLA34_00735, partial [Candidatus Krumholzibacterium sp.]|nr:hypothetical protein [Candidatus Krumholzibacterium sp.]